MGLKTENLDKLLEALYDNPNKSLTIRELSKLTKLPKSTLQPYLSNLKKNKLFIENKAANESILFKTKKTNYYVEKIVSTGLLDHLIKELNPSCIILFGSVRKGESSKESDIDLFVESYVKKNINLEKYEKVLKHKIQLFVETNINKLPEHLFNNVVNGIKLYGSFKIK